MEPKTMWDELLELYTEDEARTFLVTPQPFLNGETPAVAMSKGEGREIWRWIDGCQAQVAT